MYMITLQAVQGHIANIENGIKNNDLDHKAYGDGAAATKKLHALKVQRARMNVELLDLS